MSKLSVSWDSWVINTCWNPLACLAITQPRANQPLFSLHLLKMNLGFAYVHKHATLPGICKVSPFQERRKLLSFTTDLKDFWHGTRHHQCTSSNHKTTFLFRESHLQWEKVKGNYSFTNTFACHKLAAWGSRLHCSNRKIKQVKADMAWRILCGGQVFLCKINRDWAAYFHYG